MNMKYINRTGIALAAFLMVLTSCKKQLEINPRQSIDANGALSSRDAINASITSCYAGLKSARLYGRDMIALPEALSDNGFATNKSGRLLPEAQNTLGAHFTTTVWSAGYANINQINNTIDAVNTVVLSPVATTAEKNNWLGQLYFLRALYYFDLVRVYGYIPGAVVAAQDKGGVPLITQGTTTSGAALALKPSRAPLADIYAQIVADLVQANSMLSATVTPATANKAIAQGMLAKVNLYAKNYTDAKRWSDSVINLAGSKMTTGAAYVSGWRSATHGETLFNVVYATSAENIGVNESLQTSFTTLVTTGNQATTGGFGDLVPTITLLNDMGITLVGGNTTSNYALNHVVNTRTNDVRNQLFEPGTNGRGPIKVECTKYLGKNGFINLDNVPVMRIAEAYLIRAEAQATVGSPVYSVAGAQADLKFLKSRRYTDYSAATEAADLALDANGLYEEILKQRRIELAFEGNRFFDLKRLGRDLVKAPHYNTVAFTDIRILPALPQGEIDGNPNLKQNAGY